MRPRIDRLSATRFTRGQSVTLAVSFTNAATRVVLIGMNAMFHWVDGRAGRPLHLTFAQVGSQLSAQIPADLVVAPPGYYLLFAMVDDI